MHIRDRITFEKLADDLRYEQDGNRVKEGGQITKCIYQSMLDVVGTLTRIVV